MNGIFEMGIIFVILIGQSILLSQDNHSMGGSFGTVTMDGKVWNQVALRPVIPVGKFGIALDLILYIDGEGNIRKDEWDFSSLDAGKNTLIDKIYYVRYGLPQDPFYLKVGALDYLSLGYGILVNGYSNTVQYPQVRKVGLDLQMKMGRYGLQGFVNDFKENIGVIGARVTRTLPGKLLAGATVVIDRNQYLGLKDSDKDGRPNIVDDFPYDKKYWIDSDGDGRADNDPLEWDIDGDGITDTLDNRIPGWELDTSIVLDLLIDPLKPEPVNIKERTDGLMGVAIDVSYPIISERGRKVTLYAQAAKLFGKTIDPTDGNGVSTGMGLTPFGLATQFGPVRFNFEYRVIPRTGRFDFVYWNRSYDIERITFQENPYGEIEFHTKESKLGKYSSQKGYYGRLNIDLGALISLGTEYQNLHGDVWSDEEDEFEKIHNQSLLTTLSLRKGISRIKYTSLYYQQRNVPNPFQFEYTESTIMGYHVGIEISSGLTLNYIFSRSFRDMNGDGDITSGEAVNISIIETSFAF